MKFFQAVEFILKFEGGYVNDEKDPGGETKFGISKRSFPELNIKALTREDAIAIYRKYYWDKVNAERLPEMIRLAVFDAAVNHGVHAAVSMLQRLLLVKIDGDCGPFTINAALKYRDFQTLLKSYLHARVRLYEGLPTWDRYDVGWMCRLVDVAILSC